MVDSVVSPAAGRDGSIADSKLAVDSLVQADAEKGAVVHTFDPNESPQERMASTASIEDRIRAKARNGGAKGLAVDTAQASVTPTITISDTDTTEPEKNNETTPSSPRSSVSPQTEHQDPKLPGALPDSTVPSVPEWFRIGWRAVAGLDQVPPTGDESHKELLASFLKEQYYGDWYHNAAVILFAVIGTHFLTLFRMGWGAIFVLLAFCSTYYTTSIARVRRRARDDIQRELVKTRLLSEHESADWMNHFLDRFWLIYEPVLSATIRSTVDQILSVNTPAFLDSLQLSTFTLGNKAPRIDSVRTFPQTEEDVVMMDWGISFTPNDISEMTPKQAKRKVNPKIALNVRLGRGIASAGVPVLLEDITFVGSMRVKLKLMNNFPHVQIVDLTFLEPPLIDFVLKPIGGETFGFDISNIPGLSSFIHEMTHSTLKPMMYDPNFFTLNLEQLLSGTPLDTAIGVLQVTVHNARGISANKIGGGSPDPYVSISINQRGELARTSRKDSTHNPTWHETQFILINSLAEALTLTVLDHNEHRKDTPLGVATFELSPLAQDAIQENLVANIIRDGKPKGELRFDLSFYPVLAPVVVDGKEESMPHTSVGIVRLTIHQAKELDHSKSVTGELNPFARVHVSSQKEPIFTTRKMKHTRDPVWESATEFLCTDRSSSVLTINVVDDREFLSDPILGFTKLKLEDILHAQKEAGKDWWPLSNCKSGRTRLSVEWKPLNMAGSVQGAGHYTPPIGIVRLRIEKAVDVKNVEATLGGKSDPYVSVLLHNIVMARTEVINNNLSPEWDQFVYVPVHSMKEVILLECMDYQHLTKDRSLGSTELSLRDLIAESTENEEVPYISSGKRTYVEPLHQDKGHTTKGTLHFTAEFIPCYFLRNMSFDAPPNEIEQAAEKSKIETVSLVEPATPTTTASSPKVTSPGTSDTPPSPRSPVKPKFEGREMMKEELLKCQSGIIAFNVIGGEIKKKARLEVLMDDGYWPILTTPKSRSVHAQFDMTGEGFIKELDFSQIYIRLNESDDIDKEAVIAEFKSDAKSFLDEALDGPAKFVLRDQNMENESIVQIQAKYIPVDITLEPRESVNNQGILTVQLLEGKDILAADRSGTSDPFATFTFNGQKVFRSQTVKKTLSPNWNESFQVTVPSRVGSDFEVEVSDWNQIEQSKSLGIGKIDLEEIQPFVGINKAIPLNTLKHGVKGEVRITLLFQPSIIAKSRKNTSTFSSAGRAMTQVGNIPMGAGKGIVHGVGNVGNAGITVVKGVFRRGHHDEANESKTSLELPTNGAIAVVDNNAAVIPSPAVAANGGGSIGSAAGVAFSKTEDGDTRAPHDYGMLKVTVISGRDLPGTSGGETIKPYVVLKAGDKEQKTKHAGKTTAPEWDETCRFLINSDTKFLHCAVWDHKTLGKDKPLGEVDIDIWNHLAPGGSSKEITAPLRESEGSVRLRLEFERGRQASLLSTATGGSPSASRFISMRKSITKERS